MTRFLLDSDSTPGYLIGQVTTQEAANIVLNNFMDAGGSNFNFCLGGDPSPADECTIVNTDTAPDANYFRGNKVNEPMHSWDFDHTWRVEDGDYPTLDYRPGTPPDNSGGHSSGGTKHDIKKELEKAEALITNSDTPALTEPIAITLNDYYDYLDGSGHTLYGLKIGQVIHFDVTVNGKVEHHTMTVKEIGDDYVVVTIASTPLNVRLYLNQPTSIAIAGRTVMTAQLIDIIGDSVNLKLAEVLPSTQAPSKSVRSTTKQSSPKSLVVLGLIVLLVVAAGIYLNNRRASRPSPSR